MEQDVIVLKYKAGVSFFLSSSLDRFCHPVTISGRTLYAAENSAGGTELVCLPSIRVGKPGIISYHQPGCEKCLVVQDLVDFLTYFESVKGTPVNVVALCAGCNIKKVAEYVAAIDAKVVWMCLHAGTAGDELTRALQRELADNSEDIRDALRGMDSLNAVWRRGLADPLWYDSLTHYY